ncbi:hypothetical protein SEA_TYPHA_96 [Mycobacterium phage Typha]|uniref:Uncharacterized protein n=1 Tax=Mycobacterium phage Typha TaxID=2517971 RepID=A0A482JCQ2_9CAUD|nr:hypothetical protein KCH40_gp073 [Mycobacterium phage Typha]QBP29751.1 hypothetical protein SEA_TYPHA_96 [Mycobacterium phage Typha]
MSTLVYTSERREPKPRPRNAREAMNRIAETKGWEVTLGIKECGHHWSIYRREEWSIRVDWTFGQHVRYATLRSTTDRRKDQECPTLADRQRSHNARFAWVADLLYRLGVSND